MSKKNKIIALSSLLSGIILFVITLTYSTYYNPEKEVPVLSKTGASFVLATSSVPQKILIPKIKLDTDVEEVGLTYEGNMATPKKFKNTGWYKYGTLPGQDGSAVIDGHVDNGLSLPGVFKHLKELEVGDDVYVINEAGQNLHFKVFDKQTYYYTEVPRTLLFNKKGDAYLNLITCDGTWLPEVKTDDHRVVVYTKLVNS
jgi:sortase A